MPRPRSVEKALFRVIRRGGIYAARCSRPGKSTCRANRTGRIYASPTNLPEIPNHHRIAGRIAPNSARFLPKTGQKVHNRQASAERRKSVKKFCKNAKKHLQFVRCRVIIFLGCERLVQIVTSVLRKPRYALMREVACAAWRRVFPRSMSDLRTGRKNYGNKGIRTLLHSAARTNVHFYFVMFLSGRTVQTRFTGFCHG